MKRFLLAFIVLFSTSAFSQNLPCAITYSSQNGGGNCNPEISDGKTASGKVTLKFTSSILNTGYNTPTILSVRSISTGTVYTFNYTIQSGSTDGLSVTYCFYGVANKDNVFNQRGNLVITLQYSKADGTTINVDKECTVVPDQDQGSLPVNFSTFNAHRIKGNVSLKWETATEQNNRGFNIQRNTKGVWETIAFVFSGADGGNSTDLLSYSYNDVNSEKGISQYRIQQVDLDNKASYSVIRSVKGEGQVSKTVVYPNPATEGKVNVVFEDQSTKAVTISDVSGRVVRQYRSVVNSLVIDGLESGLYTIQITDLSSVVSTTEKVIIKKR
jgi:hypothetical protein